MTNAIPPRWAEVTLNLILKKRDRESIAGDLLEHYREDIATSRPRRRAEIWYLRQIVGLMSGLQQCVIVAALFVSWSLLLMTMLQLLPRICGGR